MEVFDLHAAASVSTCDPILLVSRGGSAYLVLCEYVSGKRQPPLLVATTHFTACSTAVYGVLAARHAEWAYDHVMLVQERSNNCKKR